MKIVITGTTGFVANALANRLIDNNHKVYAIVRPYSNTSALPNKAHILIDDAKQETIENLFAEIQPDGVVHLASLVLTQHETKDLEALIISNILFGTRLLEACVKTNVNWFINTGTFWQHYNDDDYNPVNLYAATKQAFEDIAKYYYETQDINFVTIKLNDTFGSHDTRKKIFNLWYSLADNGDSLDMSPGEQIIDISYIENIIDAYIAMIENLNTDIRGLHNGGTFCVKSDERMTLKELASLYEEVTDNKLKINWGRRPYRDREVMMPWTKGISVPNWKQKISLKDAISKVTKNCK